MNKKTGLLGAWIMVILMACSCEDNSMCKVNEDCINMCRTYENNSVWYACSEGNCKCINEEDNICIDDDAFDKCNSICALYRPGTTAACEGNKCRCHEPENQPQD